jgi:hypothetical protein
LAGQRAIVETIEQASDALSLYYGQGQTLRQGHNHRACPERLTIEWVVELFSMVFEQIT